MKQKIIIAASILLFGKAEQSYLHAQSFSPDVIASSGMFVTSTVGSMSWTLGEIMTETYSSTGSFFTQGFQQPDTSAMLTVNDLAPENISVYPNPVVDNLTIDLGDAKGNHILYIYDITGQIVIKETMTDGQQRLQISFGELPNGVYLLSVVNTETHSIRSYKINKAE